MIRIALVRHGQSVWNREHRFTGWSDIGLTPAGVEESREAGRILARAGLRFDVCFTSVLERGVVAAEATLAGLGGDAPPLRRDWRLNERHFGALQGMGRWEAVRSFGPLQVMRIQGSYTLVPPPLEEDDPRSACLDPLYSAIPAKELPLSESLADTYARVVPYWQDVICAEARPGRNLLVVAHKNSLRVLIKHIEGVSHEDTPRLHIATGEPLVYEFDDDLRFQGRRHLVPKRRRFALWPGISPA